LGVTRLAASEMNGRATLALAAVVLLVGWAVAPATAGAAGANASLSVDVSQSSGGSATVTVTESVTTNNSTATAPVENATVDVTVLDDDTTYDGAGTYATDANGTVSLPTPGETVNVSVTATADGRSATTRATLTAGTAGGGNDTGNETNASFGQRVSSFVHALQNESNVSRIGPLVATFVLANNPGNPPAHAGPPAWLTNESKNETSGPPAHAGPPEDNGSQGPPAHAGPPDDNGSQDGSRGPPAHAGPPDSNNSSGSDDDGPGKGNGNGGGNDGGDGNGNGKGKGNGALDARVLPND
jgi:hypothetical protein